MDTLRLDVLLLEKGLVPSRERAKQLIECRLVYVGGRLAAKPSLKTAPDTEIEIRGELCPYVSRGGLKLEKALDEFGIDPAGLVCLDIGASTGGFTDCLLQRGAKRVYAIDVGHDQLHSSLKAHPDVISIQGANIRHVTPDQIGESADLAVIDVSFISLSLVLPAVWPLIKPDGRIVCLIKPQFEAGRDKLGKKGVIRDKRVHKEVLKTFCFELGILGFTLLGLTHSPITGGDGNIEFLGYICADTQKANIPDLERIVSDAQHIKNNPQRIDNTQEV